MVTLKHASVGESFVLAGYYASFGETSAPRYNAVLIYLENGQVSWAAAKQFTVHLNVHGFVSVGALMEAFDPEGFKELQKWSSF